MSFYNIRAGSWCLNKGLCFNNVGIGEPDIFVIYNDL